MEQNLGEKLFTVAIIGVGGRGGDVYGNAIAKQKDRFKIVSLCDLREERLVRFGEKYGVPENERFLDENVFFETKRADLLVIATQDRDHVRQAIKALELGYHLLLEKPISNDEKELERLSEAQEKYGGKVLVCHVLRYAPAFLKAGEIIDSGEIGKLVAINALERVAFWHQAHSFVRGNWRREEDTSSMIMQKCCHDFDLLQYYAKSKCRRLSSVGGLALFKSENAPAEAVDRCVECKLKKVCPYSAEKIYVEQWIKQDCPKDFWPFNVVADAPLSEKKLKAAIEEGPYGRCVFKCDNDVVDHQIVEMEFDNGIKAELTMTAFTKELGRRYTFFGTLGEMTLDETSDSITVRKFSFDDSDDYTLSLKRLSDGGYGHGGGDVKMIDALYDVLCGRGSEETSLKKSIESNLMAIAAEKARVTNRVIEL